MIETKIEDHLEEVSSGVQACPGAQPEERPALVSAAALVRGRAA
jgi:hypothetical protein